MSSCSHAPAFHRSHTSSSATVATPRCPSPQPHPVVRRCIHIPYDLPSTTYRSGLTGATRISDLPSEAPCSRLVDASCVCGLPSMAPFIGSLPEAAHTMGLPSSPSAAHTGWRESSRRPWQ
ncbi:hypothetical protein D1007_07330 [Hordeum vulgare]|nr:hypothetical protein D1007_07330 [Hordeum vulgare]